MEALSQPPAVVGGLDPPRLAARAAMLGIALLPVQVGISGLPLRLAPSDACFAVAAGLLVVAERAPRARLLAVWVVLFGVVTWAVVVGSGRRTILASAMFDRWFGCLALFAAAFAAGVLGVERVGRGLRWASWTALAGHVLVAVDPSAGGGRVAGRNAGLLVDPNNAGVMVACLLVIELARAVDALRDGRSPGWRSGILLAGLTWSIVETGSRTGWAALGAGGLALLVCNRDRLLVLIQRQVVRFVVVTAVLVGTLRATIADQLRSLQFRPDNIARRSEVLEQSWSSFVDHPLTGGGLMHTLQLGIGFPHNSMLWLLGDAGVLGLVGFAAIVIVPMRWLAGRCQRGPLHRPLLCGLVTMIVASIGIEALYQRQWWVLIGAAAALTAGPRPPAASALPPSASIEPAHR